MALPTRSDLKTYLRIETETENALLDALLLRARAQVQAWIDVPLVAESQTFVDRAESVGKAITSLVFPRRPIDPDTVTITDGDAVAVTPSYYRVDGDSGVIWRVGTWTFDNGPYTIVADCGLDVWSGYARVEPLVSQCILDLAADLYQKRTPHASSETAAGTTIAWDNSRDVASRVEKVLRTLKLPLGQ